MCKNDIAFDLSKVAGSTYYARKNGKVVACHINKLGVRRATIPTDKPYFFFDIVFADGQTDCFHARVLPKLYFTAEDTINDSNCIADLPICGYHYGLTNHGHHFAKELLDNGNTAKVGYIWDADEMKAVKIIDMPLYDYVNGKFYASSADFNRNKPLNVYRTMEECVRDNSNIEAVEFDTPEEEDGNKPHIVFIQICGRALPRPNGK